MIAVVGEVASMAVFYGDGGELRHRCCGGVGGAAAGAGERVNEGGYLGERLGYLRDIGSDGVGGGRREVDQSRGVIGHGGYVVVAVVWG